VNVLLNLFLIPSFGAAGCCMAALVSQYGCGLALWLTASKKLSLSLERNSVLLYLVVAFFCSALFYSGQRLTSPVWIILSSIALIGFVLLLTQRNLIKKLFIPD
jgi:peptidoglycan biosynthesis protein MviN/MurJ (putative lipid II flippase)